MAGVGQLRGKAFLNLTVCCKLNLPLRVLIQVWHQSSGVSTEPRPRREASFFYVRILTRSVFLINRTFSKRLRTCLCIFISFFFFNDVAADKVPHLIPQTPASA